jgi:hypothetical protein
MAAGEQTNLAALKEIGNGCGGFAGIAGATGDGEDQVAEGKL